MTRPNRKRVPHPRRGTSIETPITTSPVATVTPPWTSTATTYVEGGDAVTMIAGDIVVASLPIDGVVLRVGVGAQKLEQWHIRRGAASVTFELVETAR